MFSSSCSAADVHPDAPRQRSHAHMHTMSTLIHSHTSYCHNIHSLIPTVQLQHSLTHRNNKVSHWFQTSVRLALCRLVSDQRQTGFRPASDWLYTDWFQTSVRLVSDRLVSDQRQTGFIQTGFRPASDWFQTDWFQTSVRLVSDRLEWFQPIRTD